MKKKVIALILVIIMLIGVAILFLSRKNISESYQHKGIALYDSSLFKESIPLFQKSVKWDKNNISSYLSMAKAYYNIESFDLCDSICDLILVLDNNIAEAFATKGQVQIKKTGYSKAIELLSQAISLDSTLDYAYYYRGIAHANSGNFESAILDYEKAQELNEMSVETYLGSVTARTSLEDYAGAIDDYNKIIELDKSHTQAWYMRGYLKFKLKDYKGAQDDFSQTLQLDDTHGEAYYYRGLCLAHQSDLLSSIDDFNQALKYNFKKDAALYNIGKANFGLKKYKETEEILNQLVDSHPGSDQLINAYKVLGSIGFTLNNFEKVRNYMTKGIEAFPNEAEFYYYRALALEKQKKFDEGIQDLSKSIELGNDKHEVYYARGVQYTNLHQYEEGCKDFNKAKELGAPYADIQINKFCKGR
ncbi:MAG: tetratricopeptide repeat protein [Bacteroidales bacterium]|nr:tetratricopeptide repeat protein [Bacteroidales bacterium]